jgi:hypothetical protein
MNINRHNYEEFFLMYVDHELTASERRLVEAFVRENQDLGEELHLLQQTKLVADPAIRFENKDFLMKETPDHPGINFTNYEEYFLLYADNELNSEDRRAVEAFVAQSERLSKEFSWILQCRLEPDYSISYENKEDLYRNSQDRKPLFITWYRMVAAAVLLLLGGWLVFRLNKPSVPQVKNATEAVARVKQPEPIKNIPSAVTPATPQSLENTKRGTVIEIASLQTRKKSASLSKNNQEQQAAPDQPDENKTALATRKNIEPVHQVSMPEKINTAELGSVINPASDQMLASLSHPAVESPALQKEAPDQSASQLAFASMTADPEDGINVLTTSSGKNKMRGIFRKVSRVFGKTTGMDDEGSDRAVLIGNIQIALK